jgi:hypothetical protein
MTDLILSPDGDLEILSIVSKILFCAWASSDEVYCEQIQFLGAEHKREYCIPVHRKEVGRLQVDKPS